jgi:hypothetical protein
VVFACHCDSAACRLGCSYSDTCGLGCHGDSDTCCLGCRSDFDTCGSGGHGDSDTCLGCHCDSDTCGLGCHCIRCGHCRPTRAAGVSNHLCDM